MTEGERTWVKIETDLKERGESIKKEEKNELP